MCPGNGVDETAANENTDDDRGSCRRIRYLSTDTKGAVKESERRQKKVRLPTRRSRALSSV